MKELTHRDEVHGDVRFDALAAALLNSPPLQRLGRIYQLAYSHLVYRGGTHTRLSHVMGAYHVAGRLVDALQKNYAKSRNLWPEGAISPSMFLPTAGARVESDDPTPAQWSVLRYLVSWAALLHDVGHVPLGHTLEDEFTGIYEKHDAFSSPRMAHLWSERAPGVASRIREVFDDQSLYPPEFEKVFPKRLQGPALVGQAQGLVDGRRVWQTVLLICLYKGSLKSPTKFRDALEEAGTGLDDAALQRFVGEVCQALDETESITFFPYMADIVGNTICADYLDYLRRDPRNLGLDILWDDRVISHFWIGRPMRFSAPEGDQKQVQPAHDVHMALSLVDRRGKPRLDTTTGVVELVRQRYRFAEIVYYHKTKAAASSMLAKVFQLIEAPAEVRPEHPAVSVLDVAATVKDLLDAKKDKNRRKQRLDRMRDEQLPKALLDPEIGDDSMHLMLQFRAWEVFEAAIESRDSDRAQNALRALALLKGITNRELYKVSFALNRPLHRMLIPGTKLEATVANRLESLIKRLRDGEDKVTGAVFQLELQRAMETAAEFEPDSILLYIPSLKAQAKGIETGALDRDGDVITLGEHTAVEEDVRELLRKYSNLWKFLVFVHPSLQDKAIGLSSAIDTLVLKLYSIEPSKSERFLSRHERDIQNACWFEYIPQVQRPSARMFEQLHANTDVDWSAFRRFWNHSVATGGNPEDLALHIYAATRMQETPTAWKTFQDAFPTATLFGKRVRDLRDERKRAAVSGISPTLELARSVEEIVADTLHFSEAPRALASEPPQLGLGVDGAEG